MKAIPFSFAAALLFTGASSFTAVVSPTTTRTNALLPLEMAKNNENPMANQAMRFFGAATLASLLSFNIAPGTASASSAADPVATTAFTVNLQPSSMLLSDAIKTMDMSMPSSYSALSDTKASVGNVKDLTVDASKGKSSSSDNRSSSGGSKRMAGSYAAGPTKADKKKAELEAKKAAREQFEKENIRGSSVQ